VGGNKESPDASHISLYFSIRDRPMAESARNRVGLAAVEMELMHDGKHRLDMKKCGERRNNRQFLRQWHRSLITILVSPEDAIRTQRSLFINMEMF